MVGHLPRTDQLGAMVRTPVLSLWVIYQEKLLSLEHLAVKILEGMAHYVSQILHKAILWPYAKNKKNLSDEFR